MRIGVVADDLYPGYGGMAKATEGHIEALCELGHQIWVLAGTEPRPSEPPAGVRVSRVPVWRPGHLQNHYALPAPYPLQKMLAWAEVLQVNMPTPLGVLACWLARRRGIPSVMGVHTQLESASLHFGRARPLVDAALKGWYRFIYRQPDMLIAPTPFAARMAAGFSSRRITVISNGIRLPVARSHKDRYASNGSKLLVYLGRLSSEKRPCDLLELAARLPEFTLILAGTGPLEQEIRSKVMHLGLQEQVRVLGFVSEAQKHELLAAADLFIMPSPSELQSIATLEAMAHGCAIAVADYPSSAVPEVVAEAGAGILYPPDNPNVAAGMIRALLEDEVQLAELQCRARAGVVHHDLRRIGHALEELYRHLITTSYLEGAT